MFRKNIDDDTSLVEACIGRDTAAWAILVKKYSPLISSSIAKALRKYGFNPLCEETEDIRQNVLTFIWEGAKLEKVNNRKSIAHWLSIVSQNAAIEHMRKKLAGEKPKLVSISETIIEDEILGLTQPPGRKELHDAVERSISSLPSKEQLIIKLNLLDGISYHEVSEMLNIPKGTVSSYIKRAKEKLKDDLKDFK